MLSTHLVRCFMVRCHLPSSLSAWEVMICLGYNLRIVFLSEGVAGSMGKSTLAAPESVEAPLGPQVSGGLAPVDR